MELDVIKKALSSSDKFILIDIKDNSSKHYGHTSVQGLEKTLTHLEITVSNSKKLTKLAIHRLIYNYLKSFIEDGLHSIEIKISK